ncbi:MAG TPA: hypothetical protein VK526_06725, partial [Bradyrhizobium sp.]|nr:hypothetical protein [Bradyrhizobium sp.]
REENQFSPSAQAPRGLVWITLGLAAGAPGVDGTRSSGRGFAPVSSDLDLSIDVRSPAMPGGPAAQ